MEAGRFMIIILEHFGRESFLQFTSYLLFGESLSGGGNDNHILNHHNHPFHLDNLPTYLTRVNYWDSLGRSVYGGERRDEMAFSTAFIIILLVIGGVIGLIGLIGWWEGEMRGRKNGD